jgi:UDP-N-acetylglucosamine--N-acetylmuramyl-(pentapeptide) pyrophosphoryl-undecaprenol N-acetylglucosamine transferase
MPKKIIIAAGGSGGHLYPATGLARQLLDQGNNVDLLFVASGLANNPFFDREQFPYREITSGTFARRSLLTALRSCKNIAGGYLQSRKILKNYEPDLVIGFGSYHSFPLLLGAHSLGIPIALHEQNSKPGRVIRFFSGRALLTGVYFPSAISQLKGKCIELAMPLREGYTKENCRRELACEYFGLEPNKMTVLVFGGSQGAKAINHIVSQALAGLCALGDSFQVLSARPAYRATVPVL